MHRDPEQGDFSFVFQNAAVHVPIISVKQLVKVGCRAVVGDGGVSFDMLTGAG